MLKLMKKEVDGKLQWRVVDTTTDADLTDKFKRRYHDKDVLVVSCEKFRIDRVKDYEFYVFHLLNFETREFECVSTIPSTALRNFLNLLANNEETHFGFIGVEIEEKKIKTEKGVRLFHDFWKAVAGQQVSEKFKNIPHAECVLTTNFEKVDDFDF
jgi:hypothetical protein